MLKVVGLDTICDKAEHTDDDKNIKDQLHKEYDQKQQGDVVKS